LPEYRQIGRCRASSRAGWSDPGDSGAAGAGTRTFVRHIADLDELADLVDGSAGRGSLYVRWSSDLEHDLRTGSSRDELTGVELPGLSANSLSVEPWWDDRPLRTWVARRLYDYLHLKDLRGPGTRPWILSGRECGRGPDNEPLLDSCELIAEIDPSVMDEAVELIDQLPRDWGGLRRQ
jgi:hypothetical protein